MDERLSPPGPHTPSLELTQPWLWALAATVAQPPIGHPRTGKWLWFPPLSQLDGAWAVIRSAVEADRLGFAAKAGTLGNSRPGSDDTRRPICIYTPDWRDTHDVERILVQLRALGVLDTLRYKTDQATRSGRYGAGAATYLSPAGTVTLIVPRRTREELDHYYEALAQARLAADRRRRGTSP